MKNFKIQFKVDVLFFIFSISVRGLVYLLIFQLILIRGEKLKEVWRGREGYEREIVEIWRGGKRNEGEWRRWKGQRGGEEMEKRLNRRRGKGVENGRENVKYFF